MKSSPSNLHYLYDKKRWKISLKKLKRIRRNWLLDKNSWFFECDRVRPIDLLHANAEETIGL